MKKKTEWVVGLDGWRNEWMMVWGGRRERTAVENSVSLYLNTRHWETHTHTHKNTGDTHCHTRLHKHTDRHTSVCFYPLPHRLALAGISEGSPLSSPVLSWVLKLAGCWSSSPLCRSQPDLSGPRSYLWTELNLQGLCLCLPLNQPTGYLHPPLTYTTTAPQDCWRTRCFSNDCLEEEGRSITLHLRWLMYSNVLLVVYWKYYGVGTVNKNIVVLKHSTSKITMCIP